MATPTLPSRPTPAAAPDRAAPAFVPGGGRQRRWSLALVAVLVTLGSALAFVVLWMNAGGREPVLAVADDVAAGQIIEAGDLSVVRVSSDAGITPVPSSDRDDVIGRPAATDLVEGMLLVPQAVGSDDGLDTGTAVIAIPVPTSELPSGDLETGNRVILYRTPSGAQAAATQAEIIGEARVFSVAEDDGAMTSDVRVSVTVDESLGPAVALAVRQDEIYLAKTAAG